MTPTVTVKRGSLYLSKEMCDRYFAGLDGVVLQRRDDDLLVLPVRHAAAGGYLLKRRNVAGDRVVSAADFFRGHGIEDDRELHPQTRWDETAAGLYASGVFGGALAPEPEVR